MKMFQYYIFNFVSGMNYVFIYSKALWRIYFKSILWFLFQMNPRWPAWL